MQRLIYNVNAHINNIDKIKDVFVVSYQNFEIVLRNMIKPRSEQTIAFFMKSLNSVL